jgi:hypothetical protein
MKQSEWDAYLNWTGPPQESVDPLAPARGVIYGLIAGALCWVALTLLWVAFKAVRVYW